MCRIEFSIEWYISYFRYSSVEKVLLSKTKKQNFRNHKNCTKLNKIITNNIPNSSLWLILSPHIFRIFLRCITDFWWNFENRHIKNFQSNFSDNLYELSLSFFYNIWLSSHRVCIAEVKARFETISDLAHFSSGSSAVISDIVCQKDKITRN
jgi:hypothetical protein